MEWWSDGVTGFKCRVTSPEGRGTLGWIGTHHSNTPVLRELKASPQGLHEGEIFARMPFLLFYVRNHRLHRTSRSHTDFNGWAKTP